MTVPLKGHRKSDQELVIRFSNVADIGDVDCCHEVMALKAKVTSELGMPAQGTEIKWDTVLDTEGPDTTP